MLKRAEREVEIRNTLGLHVRPSSALAELARKFAASLTIVKDGMTVDGKSSMDLLMLAATRGTALRLVAEGDDAEELVGKVSALIESGFGEE